MKTRTPASPVRQVKRGPSFKDALHDSYKWSRKPASPTVCPTCKAVFQDGRWQWTPLPEKAARRPCPACLRIADDFAAGFVTLKGEFLALHRDEILRLVHNVEAREKREHPLQRIMKVAEDNDEVLVTTTDIHLARGIGESLHHAYRGKLDYHYAPEQNLLRVSWER